VLCGSPVLSSLREHVSPNPKMFFFQFFSRSSLRHYYISILAYFLEKVWCVQLWQKIDPFSVWSLCLSQPKGKQESIYGSKQNYLALIACKYRCNKLWSKFPSYDFLSNSRKDFNLTYSTKFPSIIMAIRFLACEQFPSSRPHPRESLLAGHSLLRDGAFRCLVPSHYQVL